jgi:hypothetical protein
MKVWKWEGDSCLGINTADIVLQVSAKWSEYRCVPSNGDDCLPWVTFVGIFCPLVEAYETFTWNTPLLSCCQHSVFLHAGDSIRSCKAVPQLAMQTIRGEVYNYYSFLTSALDGGGWSASRPGRTLLPGKGHGTHWIGVWVGLKLVWTQRLEENYFASAGDRTPVVQSVVRHYFGWMG